MTPAACTTSLFDTFQSRAALGLFLGSALLMTLPGAAAAETPQDLVCKGCVSSRDIGNGAVRSIDIKNGAVGNKDLGKDAVDSSKIRDRSITGADLADGIVTFEKLATDAVYTRVLVVSPTGGSSRDNCDEIRAALASITDAAAENPYLVFLEPGLYDCGSAPLRLKPYVSLRGAGERLSHITGSYDSFSSPEPRGLVSAPSGGEISQLTISNILGSSGAAIAVDVYSIDSLLSHLTLVADGGSGSGAAVLAVESDLIAKDITTRTHGEEQTVAILHSNPKSMRLRDLTAIANDSLLGSIGLLIQAPDVTGPLRIDVRNASFTGQTHTAVVSGGQVRTVLISSRLSGEVSTFGNATIACIASFDETFHPVERDCSKNL